MIFLFNEIKFFSCSKSESKRDTSSIYWMSIPLEISVSFSSHFLCRSRTLSKSNRHLQTIKKKKEKRKRDTHHQTKRALIKVFGQAVMLLSFYKDNNMYTLRIDCYYWNWKCNLKDWTELIFFCWLALCVFCRRCHCFEAKSPISAGDNSIGMFSHGRAGDKKYTQTHTHKHTWQCTRSKRGKLNDCFLSLPIYILNFKTMGLYE